MAMIYFDNAATTPVDERVVLAMTPYHSDIYGNPSSLHAAGREARRALALSRESIAKWLGATPAELVFTSGGTEANHLALFGSYLAARETVEVPHYVVSQVEHHAVLDTMSLLTALGAKVTFVSPDPAGRIAPEDVVAAIRPNTVAVSVMAVNNELGTVQPIEAIALRVKEVNPRIAVHTDAVQALACERLDISHSLVDLAAFSAHKIHGPKGIGLLYVRAGTRLTVGHVGARQERGRRPGTENVAGIVGFAKAVELLEAEWESRQAQVCAVREAFLSRVQSLPGVTLLSPHDGAPTIVNLSLAGTESETTLMRMDLAGMAASAGSACTAGTAEPSHVLLACGLADDVVRGAIRFSFSHQNTVEEAETVGVWMERLLTGHAPATLSRQ
ncbi:MAG: cysteine desulfurase family protein [Alicyclobacillaceae bacterium]|nr:cysteine desulfurase family protein [Alicyclobacillaceae bacterium]